jgi:ribosomal-protein-alanine N-acetyltransferase
MVRRVGLRSTVWSGSYSRERTWGMRSATMGDEKREVEVRPIDGPQEIESCARIMVNSEPWITLKRTYGDSVRMMGDSLRETYVAWVGNEIAGFLILRMDGPFPGYIQTVGVAREWRKRGVGSRLVKFAEERIFRQSPNVFMCVSSFNPDALRLYKRLGYEVIGEIREFIIKGHSEILLRKSIAPLYDYFKLGAGRDPGRPGPASG